MSKNKQRDLSALNLEQLQTELVSQQSRYQKLRFAHNITPSTNSSEIRVARREVARIQTELRARELAQ